MVMTSKEDSYCPSWDGELHSWPDYVRRVRLQYETTPKRKRYLLGPKLALKLSGKAWDITHTLDHEALRRSNGTKYLLLFLRDKLGKTPIPDAGQRLEELFIKLRRQPGTSFAAWSSQVREAYQRVQRALIRARQQRGETPPTVLPAAKSARTSPATSPKAQSQTSSVRRRASVSEPQVEPTEQPAEAAGEAAGIEGDGDPLPDDFGQQTEDEGWNDWSWDRNDWWHGRWGRDWHASTKWQRQKSDETDSADEGLPDDLEWADLETGHVDIVPTEILGWILLRRSGLPPNARLSVLAATQNSLRFDDVERALRDQSEELTMMEQHHHSNRHHQKRSFWVEQENQWGLLADDFDEETADMDSVQWAVMPPGAMMAQEHGEAEDQSDVWYNDGLYDWVCWNQGDGDWYAALDDGSYVAYSEMRPWMEIEEISYHDSALGKELQDTFASFDSKVRSFREARNLVYQKGKNRGYFRPKGKGFMNPKGKKGSHKGTVLMSQGKSSGSSSSGPQKPGNAGYTGCFICGSKDHDFRNCSKRDSKYTQGSNSGKGGKSVFMVEEHVPDNPDVDDGGAESVPGWNLPSPVVLAADDGAAAVHSASMERLRYAVLDTGATETVGSMDALQHIMNLRVEMFGYEHVGIDTSHRKFFKFGNGASDQSCSYVLLPQLVGETVTSLGVHAMDVPGIPVLIGIKTMERLGARIDVLTKTLEFQKIFPGVCIPLKRGDNGHLLLDLCSNWLRQDPCEVSPKPHSSLDACSLKIDADDELAGVLPREDHESARVERETTQEANSKHEQLHSAPTYTSDVHNTRENQGSSDSTKEVFSKVSRLGSCDFEHHGAGSSTLLDGGQDVDGGNIGGILGGSDDRCEGQDKGEPQGEVQGQEPWSDRRRPVRLRSSSRTRSERCEMPGSSMPWSSQTSTTRKRISDREQCLGTLGGMRTLPAPAAICADVGFHGSAQSSGSFEQRCGGDLEGESRSTARRALHGEGGHRRCGEVSFEQVEDGAGQEAGNGVQDNSSGDFDRRAEETTEEGVSCVRRSGRGFDGSGQFREVGLRGGRGDPVNYEIVEHNEAAGYGAFENEPWNLREPCSKPVGSEVLAMIKQNMEDIEDSIETILREFQGQTIDLLEVCCGPQSPLSQMMEEKGGKVVRLGLHNGFDLSTSVGYEKALRVMIQLKPRWTWFSCPCGPTSPIQHLNERTPDMLARSKKRRAQSRKIATSCISLAKEQHSSGRQFAWEWPRTNDAWHFPAVKALFSYLEASNELFTAKLDGCMVGVRAADNGVLMKKPWMIKCTDASMASALDLRCNKQHEHTECLGHRRASDSAVYPRRFCQIVSRRILMHVPSVQFVSVPEVFGVKEMEPLSEQPMDPKELAHLKETIRKLHVRSGHPTNQALVNCLKARGVSQHVLRLAKEHQCDDCQEIRLPHPHMGVTLHKSQVLWHTLQMDIGQLQKGDEVLHFLLMCDEASHLVVGYELFRHHPKQSRNATTEEIIRALETSWIQYHGYPNLLKYDSEGAFRGHNFGVWGQERGIEMHPCPGEDHGAIGDIESLIGKVKSDARTFLRDQDCDVMSGLLHVITAHNTLDRVGGFSPSQWAYGRMESPEGRLFEGGNDDPVLCSQGVPATTMRENLNLRVKAEELYRRSQAAARISRAMNAKPRRVEVFIPGDLVYYRRFKTPSLHGQHLSHPGLDATGKPQLSRWYGPARVLATESKSDQGEEFDIRASCACDLDHCSWQT